MKKRSFFIVSLLIIVLLTMLASACRTPESKQSPSSASAPTPPTQPTPASPAPAAPQLRPLPAEQLPAEKIEKPAIRKESAKAKSKALEELKAEAPRARNGGARTVREAARQAPRPPQTASHATASAASALPAEVVREELEKLSTGHILFNPPEQMRVGLKERIEVRIAETLTKDFATKLEGRGVPKVADIKVGTFMKVHLEGQNFDIAVLNNEEQSVSGDSFTQWAWDVTPLRSGVQSLVLDVTVRIKIPGDGEEKKDLPVFTRTVRVSVNPLYSTVNFIKANWQWIITTILGSGLAGWLYRRRQTGRKGQA